MFFGCDMDRNVRLIQGKKYVEMLVLSCIEVVVKMPHSSKLLFFGACQLFIMEEVMK